MSSEARAIAYAEHTLGVHSVYDEAKEALKDLRHAQKVVLEFAQQKRGVLEQMADREAVLVSDHRGANPSMSAAAFKEMMKEVLQQDTIMVALRAGLIESQDGQEKAEAEVRACELTIKVTTGRMEELGGLLHFYAATKQHRPK